MNRLDVDALIYPTWISPPRLLGDYADADRAPFFHCQNLRIWKVKIIPRISGNLARPEVSSSVIEG